VLLNEEADRAFVYSPLK